MCVGYYISKSCISAVMWPRKNPTSVTVHVYKPCLVQGYKQVKEMEDEGFGVAVAQFFIKHCVGFVLYKKLPLGLQK
jgi:hypothetical protein